MSAHHPLPQHCCLAIPDFHSVLMATKMLTLAVLTSRVDLNLRVVALRLSPVIWEQRTVAHKNDDLRPGY